MYYLCVNTLRNMYKEVRMRVRIGNRISSAFLAEAGVKQGDNFSPLLFGIFIDQLEKFFTERCGEEEGIRIADNICRVILYADDLAIMSESPSGLQVMLRYLEEFCQIYMMEVNISKSVVVVFNTDLLNGKVTNKWEFKGQDLPIKEEFVYLGILFKGNMVGMVALTRLVKDNVLPPIGLLMHSGNDAMRWILPMPIF